MTQRERESLLRHAYNIRRAIIEMTTEAGSGHVGGSLSVTDIITILFFKILKYRPSEPEWKERDRFILSAGHLCPALYCALKVAGFLKENELSTFRQINSRLQGHPSLTDLPIVETSSGSLGQGLSVALGKALSLKLNNIKSNVYCLMSDGEQEEGSTWEAAMAASHYRADNLIGIIDRNKCQIDGSTENVIGLAPLGKKYRAFGWQVLEADGHDFVDLNKVLTEAVHGQGQPTIIIAHTTMGKGIPSIENNCSWHGKVFPPSKTDSAKEEIEKSFSEK